MTTRRTTTTPTPPRQRGAYRRQLAGAAAGAEARRTAAVILEVLAGVRAPLGAAQALGIRPQRYYVLEARAVQGLVAACEPRTRGRSPSAARRLDQLERALAAARRDLCRQQALTRTLQRALRMAPAPATGTSGDEPAVGRRRRRNPARRGLRAARVLRQGPPPGESAPPAVEPAGGGPAPHAGAAAASTPRESSRCGTHSGQGGSRHGGAQAAESS